MKTKHEVMDAIVGSGLLTGLMVFVFLVANSVYV